MVRVIVPWRAGCPHRERALRFVRGRLPYPVTVAEAPPGGWCKALAVMPAAWSCSDGDVLVIHDGDVICDGIADAVDAVLGGAAWAIPHRGVHRLSEASTDRFLAGEPWDGLPLAERAYRGVEGGGIVVLSRSALIDVPLDPRFVGWGGEDESWGLALRSVLGAPWRGKAPLVHLWHPPQPRVSRARGSAESWRLRCRYAKAQRDPDLMLALVEEARDALKTADPPLHHHAP